MTWRWSYRSHPRTMFALYFGSCHLFQVTADKKVCIVILPMCAGCFAHLLFIDQHKQVNQIALQQFCIEEGFKTLFQQGVCIPN